MKKKIFFIFISIIACFVCVFSVLAYFCLVFHYKGKNIIDEWNVLKQFKIEEIKTIQKEKDKDFVILNLADIQMCDLEDFFKFSQIHNEISKIVKKVKPNLITLTGDQTWSNENLISLKSLIRWLDGYKIPYAPVFGNHDYGNTKNSSVLDLNACCDLYEKGIYSLFSRGPSNLGSLGNYVINIMENNKIIKTLYMLDSGYEDKITNNQIEWFKWNAEGIKANNNNVYSQGMVFMHKPIPEFKDAYYEYKKNTGNVEALGDVFVFGSLSGSEQNDFFENANKVNITDIVCGHQHYNNFTLKYQNIRLTFALKSSSLSGYYKSENLKLKGATFFVLNNEKTQVNNYFC